MWRHSVAAIAAMALVAVACGGGELIDLDEQVTTSTTVIEDEGPTGGPSVTPAPTTTAAVEESGTTTTVFDRLIDVNVEAPEWETVAIPTEDGLELAGKFWSGNSTVVLVQHDFDNPSPGSAGQRPPQSSENVLLWSGIAAESGYTVLSFDFRGHGESEGDYNVRESQIDLRAANTWLTDQGFEDIILVGWVGSATSGVVLDAEDDSVNYKGIAFMFSPPQDTGLDGNAAIPKVDTPMWFVGTNGGRTASWSRRHEARAIDSFGVHVFDTTPTGLQFIDIFGSELAGRLMNFIDAAAAA